MDGSDALEDEFSDIETSTIEAEVENPSMYSIPTSFTKHWENMQPECKWVLSSTGRIVEDVIYFACMSMDATAFANTLAHCFVIDTSDSTMKSWFKDEEWNEICASSPPLPEPDLELAKSMKRFFHVKTPGMLREVLGKYNYWPEGEKYDPNVHYNAQWADVVFRRL